jgi:hypothetical protein
MIIFNYIEIVNNFAVWIILSYLTFSDLLYLLNQSEIFWLFEIAPG